jgi:hypothetical protein
MQVPDVKQVRHRRTLGSYLGREMELSTSDPRHARLFVDPMLLERYRPAIHVVDPCDDEAVTNCFTSAYGRSHVRSGSLLAAGNGARRFSPREILGLLGFPPEYVLPDEMDFAILWRLVGNSLSIDAVRYVMRALLGDENPQG